MMKKSLCLLTVATLFLPLTLANDNHYVNAPIWALDDKWFYEIEIYVKGNLPNQYKVKAIDGTWFVDNAITRVVKVDKSAYLVEVYGNLTGNATLYVKALEEKRQTLDQGEMPVTVSIKGTYLAENLIEKKNLSTISTEIYIEGSIAWLEIFPFYIKLNISYDPPSGMIRFPFKVGDSWEVSTNVTVKGEMYVKKWMDPPEKIDERSFAAQKLTCLKKEKVETKAGVLDAYHIIGSEGGDLWYSEEAKNVVKGMVQQFSMGNVTFTVYMDLKGYNIKLPPSVNITYPELGYLYFFGKKLFKLKGDRTIAIGPIMISASVQNESPLDRVEFYMNEKLSYTTYAEPFEWVCREKYVGDVVFRCVAYDVYGKYGEDYIKIKFINPF